MLMTLPGFTAESSLAMPTKIYGGAYVYGLIGGGREASFASSAAEEDQSFGGGDMEADLPAGGEEFDLASQLADIVEEPGMVDEEGEEGEEGEAEEASTAVGEEVETFAGDDLDAPAGAAPPS
jgi:hypothetical protein